MKSLRTLVCRGLTFHWRSHMAVLLCVATASAVLTGAMLVGDSIRGSLRELVLDRLGRVDYALRSTRYFREVLAEELAAELPSRLAYRIGADDSPLIVSVVPAVAQTGSISRVLATGEETDRVGRVHIWGVGRGFWELACERPKDPVFQNWDDGAGRDEVVLGDDLATELGVRANDSVLVRVELPSDIPREAVLGRKDDAVRVLRLQVAAVVPPRQLGRFALEPNQRATRNAFVPLGALQRAFKMTGRVNTLLVVEPRNVVDSPRDTVAGIQAGLANRLRHQDLGLQLRLDASRGYVSLESSRMVLERGVAAAAQRAAEAMNLQAAPVVSYLANSITRVGPKAAQSNGSSAVESHSLVEIVFQPLTAAAALVRSSPSQRQSIPYSTVAGVSFDAPAPLGLRAGSGLGAAAPLADDEILLNDWAARELGVAAGGDVQLEYYVAEPARPFETARATFQVRGVMPITGVAADRGLVPDFPGITDAKRYADWDPPFPMDLKRIQSSDEEYWEQHRATPKAFLSLAAAERLWGSRFGHWTSFRIAPKDQSLDLEVVRDRFGHELRDRLDPAQFGLVFRSVKAEGLAAASGTTDFAGLFIGFSFFLIISACILVALVFRLSVERRAKELGTLLSLGFDRRAVVKLLVCEGGAVTAAGSAAGLAAGVGYAWLMMLGLRTWWLPAVGTSELRLHVTATSLAIGAAGGMVLAVASIVFALRGLTRLPPRMLLAGSTTTSVGRPRVQSWALPIAVIAGVIALAQLVVGFALELSPAAFFVSGTALLVASLATLAAWLAAEREQPVRGHGLSAIGRMGARNGARHRGRSVLTAGLVASATFVVVTVAANRQETVEELRSRDSGSGGFAFVAESDAPLLHDLNTSEGRRSLGLRETESAALDSLGVYRFRLRPGEDASCLNLYQPTRPRILGAPADVIARGGFRVAGSLAETPEEKRGPWHLLNKELPDGAIPAIGDANTVQWILHLGLGDALIVRGEDGREVPLVIVATLAHSLFQSELVVSETNFLKLFPSQTGHSYFLIENRDQASSASREPLTTSRQPQLPALLEQALVDYGFDMVSTTQRLAEYRSVENTYLSTFQMLGGLGLALGTLGLAAVLLRNVIERRGELALLLAVGYRPGDLVAMVLAENVFLLVVGLASGTVSALAAMLPHIVARGDQLPFASIAATLAIVFATGMASSVAAVYAATRTPLVPALRAD